MTNVKNTPHAMRPAQPRFSPDGRLLLLRRTATPNCDLWTFDLERGALVGRVRLGLGVRGLGGVFRSLGRTGLLAAAMGARTERIKLRTSVLLAPLYDPIRLLGAAVVVHHHAGARAAQFQGDGRFFLRLFLEDRKSVV